MTTRLILSCALAFGLSAQTPRLTLAAAADSIKAADLLRDITYLASDELAGRATPSPGQEAAATYIERALREIGVKPFGDTGGYRQRYVVTRATLVPKDTTLRIGGKPFAYGKDFVLTSFLMPPPVRGGSVVYVGTGIRSPKLGWDPYQGLNVHGKWLLVHAPNLLPEGVTREMLGVSGQDHMLPAQEARTRGALGLLVIPAPAELENLDAVAPRPTTARDLNPSVGWAYAQNPLPHVRLSKAALETLLEGQSVTAETILASDVSHRYGQSFVLNASKSVWLDLAASLDHTDAFNVVGIIEGSDPQLKEEYITVSSHLDGAVGRVAPGAPAGVDTIYNAADDNASGSAGNMAIARALMQGPRPRRTIVLIWDTGEETGLWGSRHIAYGPMSEKIVAHLCVDMIGRTKQPGTNNPQEADLAGPGEVFVAGPGVLSTQMDAVLAKVARDFPFAKQNRKFDDAKESFFYPRTDAAPYFERKIPYVEFFTGLHADYHRPSDDVSKIDPAKMEAVTRTVYVMLSMLADDPVRPRMDKALPPNLVALLAR
jgi:hypothetical protein